MGWIEHLAAARERVTGPRVTTTVPPSMKTRLSSISSRSKAALIRRAQSS